MATTGPFGDYHCHQQGCRLALPAAILPGVTTAPGSTCATSRIFTSRTTGRTGCWWVSARQSAPRFLRRPVKCPSPGPTPGNAKFARAKWIYPYTGEEYVRAARLELDHIIPPSYANVSNGFRWDDRTRMEFANDPLNLIPVSRDVYRKKRERPIASWRPPEENFHCEYAAAWRDISRKYDLDLFASDRTRMNNILKDCDIPEKDFESRKMKLISRLTAFPYLLRRNCKFSAQRL